MSIQKRSRCKNGTRRNKKTGKCENVLDNTCPICLDRIVSGNIKTTCKHNFHKKCLIGWCNGNRDNVKCPICRSDINDTCKKILPFNSGEIFRYTGISASQNRDVAQEKIREMIRNPKFDINIIDEYGRSLLHELSWNAFNNHYYKEHIEYLLQQPKIKVSTTLIRELIARNNQNMLAVYKKHKKIPKSLINLI